ncbi:hypothetical protein KGP36_02755 [Patescibacteria group bacterium]|nr:hypothetical protein [Patescibacteria group bacterium]
MRIPQFELPGQENAFNLWSETAIDGEKATRDREERERAKGEAAEKQDKEQLSLI